MLFQIVAVFSLRSHKEEPVVDRLIFIFLQTKFDNMYCCRESILDRYVNAKNDKVNNFCDQQNFIFFLMEYYNLTCIYTTTTEISAI